MRYAVLVNITERKIKIIDNVENVVNEIEECCTTKDPDIKLFDFSYQITEDDNNNCKSTFTTFSTVKSFIFFTNVEPMSNEEQEKYHTYDIFNFDSVIDFWKEVYGNKVS